MCSTKVSVIIPYLKENKYIRNTVASVCAQKKFDVTGIEILIVDSTANSTSRSTIDEVSICKIISNPNINTGSAAFNLGLEHAQGKYIAFMNCGDTISENFFSECIKTAALQPQAAFVCSRSICINPSLDKPKDNKMDTERFEYSALINVNNAPQQVQLWATETLFPMQLIQNRKFDESLKYEFEQDFMLKLQLECPKYATALKPGYSYFMPKEDDFLYYLPANYKDWYTPVIKNYLLPLTESTKDKNGKVKGIVQFYVMFALQARFLSNMNNRNKHTMNSKELKEFFTAVGDLLQNVSDSFILNKDKFKELSYSEEAAKMFVQIKYNLDTALPLNCTQGKQDAYLNYENVFITRLSTQRAAMHVLDYFNGNLCIDGSFREVFDTDFLELYVVFNGKKTVLRNTDRYSLTKYFGISAYKKFTFHLELPLDETAVRQSIAFYARIGETTVPLKFSFIHHWSKFCVNPAQSYWRFNKYIATLNNLGNEMIIEHASAKKTLKCELKFLPGVFKESKRGFLTRIMYWITRPYFKNKRIWLMYDKMYKGGDSSEYLYRYCQDKKDGITRYYIIDKDTPEYKQMRSDGLKPVKNHSLKHKMAFLNADIALITNSNVFPFNGYNMDKSRFIRNLCNFPSMCLQHGLSVQKCAMAQQRIVDNTKMYFLASKHEEENLSNHVYSYKGKNILKMTGIGRYDGLINNDQKKILLSPTWRMYNAMPVTTSEGEQRSYNPEFKHTTYFKIYNSLINDKKLIDTAKQTGYTITFLLHPILSAQAKDFKPDPYVQVIPSVGDLSYEEILTKSSLMVTDYSGVQFDFAYMKKPLVYFHPSQLPAHYDDGGFFYDTMGFGEICTESDQLTETLCQYMNNNCVMKPQYVKRVDDFYAYSDHNNCQRIYNEIFSYQQVVDKDKLRS